MKTVTVLSVAALLLGSDLRDLTFGSGRESVSAAVEHGPDSPAVDAGDGAIRSRPFARRRVPNQPVPVGSPEQVRPDQLPSLVDTVPTRRVAIRPGGATVVADLEGGSGGSAIYRNIEGTFLFSPGAGVRIADDIRTICSVSELNYLEVRVGGGGDGTGSGFDAVVELFDGCPSSGGQPIAGALVSASLPDDGNWIVALDYSAAPVRIGGSFWIALRVSTDEAGWFAGSPADVGESLDVFDGVAPCAASLGGWPEHPHASFHVSVYAAEGSCSGVYKAYEASASFDSFLELGLSQRFADDLLPISAPELCELTRYDSALAGVEGPYTIHLEIWTHDEVQLRALAPVLGTQRQFAGLGLGLRELATFELNPPILVDTPKMWITYDADNDGAGPLLVADFPEVGFSDDCFALFGNPDHDEWSPCMWFLGGCPYEETGYPCGTFQNTLFCAGTEQVGACCDAFPAETCRDNVPITQCSGRFAGGGNCATDPFDPPCGAAACCRPEGTCQNLTSPACAATNGLWQPGELCGEGEQTCPPPACLQATQPCGEIHGEMPGCADPTCCADVCGYFDFCCQVGWDHNCVSLAADICSHLPPDSCQIAATTVCNGSLVLDNTLGNTTANDPGFSCHNAGAREQGEGAVWAKFVALATTARVRTCNSDSPADDSLLAVYSGACNSLVEIGCSDDADGCQVATGYNSDLCVSGLIPGRTYYIQLAAWTNADRGRYNVELECPAPASCLPPAPPVNDNCADALPLFLGGTAFSTLNATTDGPALLAPLCDEGFGVGMGRDIWYDYTATGTGTVTMGLCTDTDFDTRVAVYSGITCPAQTANTLACDDDGCSDTEIGVASSVSFPVTPGQRYKLRVGGFGASESGSGMITVTFSGTMSDAFACCTEDGLCDDLFQWDCDALHGIWYSDELCGANGQTCPPWGSCCGDDGACAVTPEADCPVGQWTQDANCSPNGCPQPGACCAGDGACSVTFAADCPTGLWRLHGDCAATDCVAQPAVEAVGARYLAITPGGDSAIPLALHVTSLEWPCLSLYVDANGRLREAPTFRTSTQWGTHYVGDTQIIPQTTYQVVAENGAFGSSEGTATTWRWGDANQSGAVNFDDILCVLSGFAGAFGECTPYGVDLIGGQFNPDRTVSLDDILAVLAAFGGAPYATSTPCD